LKVVGGVLHRLGGLFEKSISRPSKLWRGELREPEKPALWNSALQKRQNQKPVSRAGNAEELSER
jgi:hypothetical protein